MQQHHCHQRHATAAAELAICLPLLVLVLVIGVNWGRVFYYDLTIENCARQGALYASNSKNSPYTSLTQAALADPGSGFQWPGGQQPQVTSTNGSDSSGNGTVTVTVTWTFPLGINYPGVGSTVSLSRSCTMRVVSQ